MRYFFAVLILLLLIAAAGAQDQFRRIELSLGLGRHIVLNDDLSLPDEGSKGYGSYRLRYYITETQALGLHYGASRYGETASPNEDKKWIDDFFATYRHSWRKRQPTRIYFEVGLGVSDAIPPHDSGNKFALSFAVGVKRFIGQHFSFSLESRGVGFTQGKLVRPESEDTDVVMAINEFTFVLGYMF